MLILAALIGGLLLATSGVLSPIMDAEFQRGMAATLRRNPQLTADQMATGRHIGEIIAKVGAFIFVPIGIFFTGLFLWIIGKAFDAKESLHTALVVAAYATVPRVLEVVLSAVQAMFMDPASLTSHFSVSLSAARFLNPDTASPLTLSLLGHLDVFTIWLTALLAIGLSVTGKIPRSRAAFAAAFLWVLGIVPGLIQAARSWPHRGVRAGPAAGGRKQPSERPGRRPLRDRRAARIPRALTTARRSPPAVPRTPTPGSGCYNVTARCAPTARRASGRSR